MHCFLHPPKGCTCWWLKETPYPYPHRPLHSIQTSLNLPNISSSNQSWESKKVLGPFQCMKRNVAFFQPPDEGIQSSTWGLHLTQIDFTSTSPPKKHILLKKAFQSTFSMKKAWSPKESIKKHFVLLKALHMRAVLQLCQWILLSIFLKTNWNRMGNSNIEHLWQQDTSLPYWSSVWKT